MSRFSRPSPLPNSQESRVSDPTLQRVLDGIFTPLKAVVDFLQPFVQAESWKAPVYTTGWGDYTGALDTYSLSGYRKSPLGRVELRGLVERLSGTDDVIFTLPVGYRPSKKKTFVALGSIGAGQVTIATDGTITYDSGGDSFFSLEGITFDTVG